MKNTIKGHLAILFCNIIFGLNIPIAKMVMPEYMDAYAMAFFRTVGACALFWLASLFTKKEKVPNKDKLLFFAASIFAILTNQMLFVKGLEYISPIEAGIVVTFTPIITMLLAAIFLREPISFKKVFGVLLGLSGAVYMVYTNLNPEDRQLSGNAIGIIMCILSGLSYAIYLTAFKPLVQKYSPISVMKWMFLFGGCLTATITHKYVVAIDFSKWSYINYLQIAYVVCGATFITYLLIPIAQKNIRPTILSMYNYVQPITAMLLAVIIGMDTLSLTKIIASVLVFVGVWFVSKSKSRQDIEMGKRA